MTADKLQEDEPLSILDIVKKVGRYIPMVVYPDLWKYDYLEQILTKESTNGYKGNNEAIILYQTGDNFGHWTCIFKRPKSKNGDIEYFDSYGYDLDEALPFMESYYRKVGKHLFPHLSALLLEYLERHPKAKIYYNNHILQGPKTTTCGRWVADRLINKDKTIDTYVKKYKNHKNKDLILLSE